MARLVCEQCNYPQLTCVCYYITPAFHKTQVTVLQHPSEVKNAKNTVKLMVLVSNKVDVFVGENESDFALLKTQVDANPERFLVLFPSEQSNTWAKWQQLKSVEFAKYQNNPEQPLTLIVIDGTWKKAKKIFLLNPWLQQINALKIEGIETNYDIRKTSITGALSTIEATALALKDIDNVDTNPFDLALKGLNSSFTKQMPSHVKDRYKKTE